MSRPIVPGVATSRGVYLDRDAWTRLGEPQLNERLIVLTRDQGIYPARVVADDRDCLLVRTDSALASHQPVLVRRPQVRP